MDEKEQKQEEFTGTDSSAELAYYWELFNVDLCDIVAKDLVSLFTSQDETNTDNIDLSANEQAIMEQQTAQKKNLQANAKILISNTYGKTFILYPQYHTLIACDCIAMTNYAMAQLPTNDDDAAIPERGVSLPPKLYRVFTHITANKMRLSHDEQYIVLFDHSSFNVHHIAQFFNETQPKPMWNIALNDDENILKIDWNENALFLVIDKQNTTSGSHERILKHYALSSSLHTPPKYMGIVPNITHSIMEIKLWMNDTFALCLRNGFVVFYKYSPHASGYEVIHTINMSTHHEGDSGAHPIPYLMTLMKECNEICIHYGIETRDNKYTPYFCVFRYGADANLKSTRCVVSAHTGFSALGLGDMCVASNEGIKSMYVAHLNVLIFCCKYDYKPAIYGPKREALNVGNLIVKYDCDYGNGNICDIALDVHNESKCWDEQTETDTLPPAPILVLLTDKLNFGCFNIIPYDDQYDETQSLPIMKKAIRSLPPIPAAAACKASMSKETLDQYKVLYRKYFTDLYLKYAPDKVAKIENLMTKYSDSLQQLQNLYDKLIKKYEVKAEDIQPLVSEQQINAKAKKKEALPRTPIKTNLMSCFDAVSESDQMQTNEIQSALDFAAANEEEVKDKTKKAFSSAIFDDNVPNQEVEYEFFNAFKQIQVEIERLRVSSNTLKTSMKQTESVLDSACGLKLKQLGADMKQEKENRNHLESRLDGHKLKDEHQEMYRNAMRLKTKSQKLKDPTYSKALKMRGLDEDQEKQLIGISDKINSAQKSIDAWREYTNDERHYQHKHSSDKQTPNEVYKSCVKVENLVTDRYHKYKELVSQHAPHLLMQSLVISPPRKSTAFSSPIRCDALYAKHMQLRATPKYQSSSSSSIHSTPRNKWSKLSKYEKRLNHSKATNKSKYNPFLTPTTISSKSTTPHGNTPSHSPNNKDKFNISNISNILQPPSRRLSSAARVKVAMDFKSFETKIQRTPCKSAKKPEALKKLMTEKKLSRQQSIAMKDNIGAQTPSYFKFDKTPGFNTIKRKDRRRAARLQRQTPPEYKAPQKPSNFVQFSPTKKEIIVTTTETKVESPPQRPPSPIRAKQKKSPSKSDIKPAVERQATEVIESPAAAQTMNNILGLTQTPPPLQEEKEEKKEAKSNWQNTTNTMTNAFGSFGVSSKVEEAQAPPVNALSVYKERVTNIYNKVGQSQKLQKVLPKFDANNNTAWMHSLYVKICGKYNVTPQGMVSNTMQQNTGASASGGWGSFGNTANTGFGSMSNWNTNNNESQTNAFSNFGSGNNNNNNNSSSSFNWGNNGGSSSNNMTFASTSNSNQPSWVTGNLSMNAAGNSNGGNNNNNQSDPFAAFASGGGGFGSLLS